VVVEVFASEEESPVVFPSEEELAESGTVYSSDRRIAQLRISGKPIEYH
jgi:hypothetical protein